MPEATLQTAKTEDRIVILSKTTKQQIANDIGLRVEDMDANDVKKYKLVETMADKRKPLDFVIEFDGQWFTLTLKIGTWKHEFNAINLIQDKSIKNRKQVVQNLINFGAATKKQLDWLNERNQLDD